MATLCSYQMPQRSLRVPLMGWRPGRWELPTTLERPTLSCLCYHCSL